jgi:hypothetical protein
VAKKKCSRKQIFAAPPKRKIQVCFVYSGKKKRHTVKPQIIVDVDTQEVICTAQTQGSEHDFTLFKAVRAVIWGILLLADSGCQGLPSFHRNSRVPYKRNKGHSLPAERRLCNRTLVKDTETGEKGIY